MHWLIRSLIFLVAAASIASGADDGAALEQKLKSEYEGKTLILRHLYCGSKLTYDVRGNLIGGGPSGPWTLCGKMHVTKLVLDKRGLTIEGERVFLLYDPERKELRDVFTLDPSRADAGRVLFRGHPELYNPESKLMKELRKDREVRIRVTAKGPDLADPQPALNQIFLPSEAALWEEVPSYWRDMLRKQDSGIRSAAAPAEDRHEPVAEKVGGKVSAPHAKSAPDPEYSEAARKAGLEGTVVVSMVVDPYGEVRDIRITRPVGLGLDEHAVTTISQWRFDPALKDGKPVAVQVNVEVNFRLY